MTIDELRALERWVSDVVVEVNKAGREASQTGEVSRRRAVHISVVLSRIPWSAMVGPADQCRAVYSGLGNMCDRRVGHEGPCSGRAE